jgi:hypothetical protein
MALDIGERPFLQILARVHGDHRGAAAATDNQVRTLLANLYASVALQDSAEFPCSHESSMTHSLQSVNGYCQIIDTV